MYKIIIVITKDWSTYADLPARLEAGTPHIAGGIAFAHAIDYLNAVGMENIHAHEADLLKYALERLEDLGGLTLYGTKDLTHRGGVVSFNVDGVHAHDVGSILDEQGIAIRVGHHCCQPYMKKMGIAGTCRASFYLYNTREDVDALVEGLKKVMEIFARVVKR